MYLHAPQWLDEGMSVSIRKIGLNGEWSKKMRGHLPKDMGGFIEGHLPFGLAAVALSLESSHCR